MRSGPGPRSSRSGSPSRCAATWHRPTRATAPPSSQGELARSLVLRRAHHDADNLTYRSGAILLPELPGEAATLAEMSEGDKPSPAQKSAARPATHKPTAAKPAAPRPALRRPAATQRPT